MRWGVVVELDRSILMWLLITITIVLATVYIYHYIQGVPLTVLILAFILIGVVASIDTLVFKVMPTYRREKRFKEYTCVLAVLSILVVIFTVIVLVLMRIIVEWVV